MQCHIGKYACMHAVDHPCDSICQSAKPACQIKHTCNPAEIPRIPSKVSNAAIQQAEHECVSSANRMMTDHVGGMQELLRARHITMTQVGRLEEAWKADPAASLDTLSQPSPDEEPAPVALK